MTRERKRILLGLATLATMMVVALPGAVAQAEEPSPNAPVLPTPAGQKQPSEVSPLSPEQCAYGYYCAWKDQNWTGTFWFWGNPKNTWFYVGAGVNDQITSDWNRHQNAVYANKDWTPKTFQFCINAGGSHWTYAYVKESEPNDYPQPPYPNINDTISGLYIQTSPC